MCNSLFSLTLLKYQITINDRKISVTQISRAIFVNIRTNSFQFYDILSWIYLLQNRRDIIFEHTTVKNRTLNQQMTFDYFYIALTIQFISFFYELRHTKYNNFLCFINYVLCDNGSRPWDCTRIAIYLIVVEMFHPGLELSLVYLLYFYLIVGQRNVLCVLYLSVYCYLI